MDNPHQAGPQPDFDAVAQSFKDVAENMQLCNNLPQVQLAEIVRTGFAEMREGFAEMREGFAEMRREFASIRIDMYNQQVRIENTQRHLEHIDLLPLRSFTLAPPQDIPDFPASAAAVDAMNATALNALLQHLQQPVWGTVAEKKKVVKRQVGIYIVRTATQV